MLGPDTGKLIEPAGSTGLLILDRWCSSAPLRVKLISMWGW